MPKGLLRRRWTLGAAAATGARDLDHTALQSAYRRLLRLGVSAKLQIAFGAVAGLTMLAAAVGFISFSSIEVGLQRVINHQMPAMTNAMHLSVISGNISAAAARFISAKTDEDQRATVVLMGRLQTDLTAGIAAEKQEIGESPALAKVIELSKFLEANLAALEEAISQRTQLRERIEEMLDGLHQVHAQIIEELAHISNSAQALEVSAHTSPCQSDQRRLGCARPLGIQEHSGSFESCNVLAQSSDVEVRRRKRKSLVKCRENSE